MTTRDQLIRELEDFLFALSTPLTDLESAHGWTEQTQKAMLQFFSEIRAKIMAGEPSDKNIGRGVVRSLDHFGVGGGPLFNKICVLSNHLSDLID